MQDMLVDALVCPLLDPGSSPGTSTKQIKTKFLSSESTGDVKSGAFVVLRVGFVLGGGVHAHSNKPILWTGFWAEIGHLTPIFSLRAGFLCCLLDFSK